jgi:hypothetical protein
VVCELPPLLPALLVSGPGLTNKIIPRISRALATDLHQPHSSSTYGIPGLILPGTARPGVLLKDAALALPPALYSDDGIEAASYSR